ncbi:MAG: fibronectin type III domain-containing protein [Verrucomicrobiota bacterium]
MRCPKLGFRNKSALAQLLICQRVVANLTRAPKAQLVNVALAETRAAVAAARTSHERLEKLKADLKAETRRRDELLRLARDKVTRAQLGQFNNLNHHAEQAQAAGMELPGSKRRSVGEPAKVANLRAVPATHSTDITLRWERSVRRCSFEIQIRLEGEPESEWQHHHVCLRQRCEIKGLKSGGLYWFRVRAHNAHGSGPWSNPVSARVR